MIGFLGKFHNLNTNSFINFFDLNSQMDDDKIKNGQMFDETRNERQWKVQILKNESSTLNMVAQCVKLNKGFCFVVRPNISSRRLCLVGTI